MKRLTETDDCGNWGLREFLWNKLYAGAIITRETYEALYGALCKLKDYEDTGLSPDEVVEINDFKKSQVSHLLKQLNQEQQNHRWILVEERLPEDGTYLCTFVGELVGQEDPFTGMCGIENGIWDEPDCVIAWQPLPEPYKGGQNEA